MGRLYLLLIVALGLAPGTWVRSDRGPPDARQLLYIDRLTGAERDLGEIEVAGAWQLRSPNQHFHGYSALIALEGGTLLAVTDGARMMRLAAPDGGRPSVAFGHFARHRETEKRFADSEGVTRDPATGNVWAVYESTNKIERYDANHVATGTVRSPQMRSWPTNTGPEAIVRLADGRFVVLSEGSPRWFADDSPGLLFPSDPVAGARPETFRFRPPEDFRPVDMAQLPDGRVLILLRAVRWALPPRFEGKLVVADPADIAPGELWPWQEVADLREPLPMDNYEGLAVALAEDGGVVLWLISDDNSALFQRTLLLKLLWRPNEKARGIARAPR